MEEAQPVNGSSLSHIQLTQWPLRCGARRMLTKLTAITRENLRVLAPIKRFAPRLHDDYRPRVLTPARVRAPAKFR